MNEFHENPYEEGGVPARNVPAQPAQDVTNLPAQSVTSMQSMQSMQSVEDVQPAAAAEISQPADVPQEEKRSAGTSWTRVILCVLVGIIAAALVSLASVSIYKAFAVTDGNSRSSQYKDFGLTQGETPKTDTTIKSGDTVLTAAQIAAKVRPSIVGVITTDNVSYDAAQSGQGSGIIIDSDGYIITNSHVIGDSSKYSVSVVTEDGKDYPAKVVGYDVRSDLAVLKIDAKGLPAVEFGDSSQLVPGDYVVAIGNPGGMQFAGSVTDGIVSGLNRIIDSADTDSTSAMRYIQTNAVINPGNSGGALVNAYGQVVGVNTSKISAAYYEAMCFAIPSSTVLQVSNDLVKYGYVQGRVKLGITCSILPSTYESQGIPAGLQIREIQSESDLNGKAQPYDIITHCDGKRVKTLSQFQDILFEKKPGDTVTLTLVRPSSSSLDTKEFKVTVTLLEDRGSAD